MKIIELLYKIANSQEVPKIVKYKELIYEYEEETHDYLNKPDFNYLFSDSESLMDDTKEWLNSEIEILDKEHNSSKVNSKELFEALGYAMESIKKCMEKGFDKAITEQDEDKDIPLIPDDELFLMKQNGADIRGFDYLDYNFKVLKEKINQVVKEFNEYRKEEK